MDKGEGSTTKTQVEKATKVQQSAKPRRTVWLTKRKKQKLKSGNS